MAEVLVNVAAQDVDRTFDYLIPPALSDQLQKGARVVVPFGPRKVQGYVLNIKDVHEEPQHRLKSVEQVLDEKPPLTEELIELGHWMKREYTCLLVSAMEAMIPAVLKAKTKRKVTYQNGKRQTTYEVADKVTQRVQTFVKLCVPEQEVGHHLEKLHAKAVKQRKVLTTLAERQQAWLLSDLLAACDTTLSTVKALEEKGLVQRVKKEKRRDPYAAHHFERSSPLPLTEEQQQALQQITAQVDRQESRTFLVHGVTGSGKTELYLQSIAYILEQGKEAIVLVPEISLTPQMVERFKGRFGEQVAVLHSRLSSGERYDEWRRIRDGQVKVAIGARSALFAPFQNLGLIIIDEEHESSYKQEESPKYHARDVAIFRAQYHQVPVVLGSATPTLESFARAQKGVYQLISLHQRIQGSQLPEVEVVDMRQELKAGNRTMFSRPLYEKINACLERREQMVLFLNRRGYNTFVMCRDCGYVAECPHCDISLTFHKRDGAHRCHYCGYEERQLSVCPQCESEHIRFFGTGTQKVEEELYKHFPGIRVIRMDVDTTQKKGAHEQHLQAFREQKADCLLGTQMIAKGLDFERVTLVGVIAADALLHLPDFRAAEKTFQLLTQVSGRAGRHELPGKVVVQSYTPDHYSIETASKHDYNTFYQLEMKNRRQRGYPPYYFLTLITFSHPDLPYLVKVCEQSVQWVKQQVSPNTIVLGPVASPIPRIKDRYRYQCMIKYRDEPQLGGLLTQLIERNDIHINKNDLILQVDRNPQILM
nr:primosomal protein N' [Caldalkalibacillus salinus]